MPSPRNTASGEYIHHDQWLAELVDDDVADITDEHIAARLRETLASAGYAVNELPPDPAGPPLRFSEAVAWWEAFDALHDRREPHADPWQDVHRFKISSGSGSHPQGATG